MSQNTATLNLTINQFRPLGGVFPISATLSLSNVQGPASFVTHGKNLKISFPQSQPAPVVLTFALNDPDHVLLGIVFAANQPGKVSAGRSQFPTINISRNSNGQSSMVVTDNCLQQDVNVRFNYLILVQSLSKGEVGIIDPDIDDQGGE